MKVMEKNLKQTKQFTSSSSEGDLFAGRSNRQYYFPLLRLLQRMSRSAPRPAQAAVCGTLQKVIVCGNSNLKVFSVECNLINKQ